MIQHYVVRRSILVLVVVPDRLKLADAMNPILGLLFHCRVPPRVHHKNLHRYNATQLNPCKRLLLMFNFKLNPTTYMRSDSEIERHTSSL